MKKPSPEQLLIQQHNCTWSVAHHAVMRAKVELGHHYTVKLKVLPKDVQKSIVKAASALIDAETVAASAANNIHGHKTQQENNNGADLPQGGVPLGLQAVPANRRPIGLEFHSLHDPNSLIANKTAGGRAFLKT
ncbi:unnamed protein product [Cylindrotheca closterium]|uniref:Uncharacterized protein n=1 Tax=Cylindrotheca closterium TaxID=2856 RepID=A0AAD2JQF5_9STRA|nr:unnamed protein product [Cylindrotheca closterium]